MSQNKKTLSSFKELGQALGQESKPKPQENNQANHTERVNRQENKVSKKEIVFLQEEADYVGIAEKRMQALRVINNHNPFGNLTTSKIRNILSLVNELYSEIVHLSSEEIPTEIVDRIRYIKVRLAYEAGRENSSNSREVRLIEKFIRENELIEAIDEITHSKKKYIRYSKYMEALVAYHRFLGGKDN